MSATQTDFAFELVHDGWSEKLAREFALKLLPHLDKSYSQGKCRDIADALALLAAKRARAATALRDDHEVVLCRSCDTSVFILATAHLCSTCAAAFRSAGSDG
jgi:predicted nucleic acid-binding protein